MPAHTATHIAKAPRANASTKALPKSVSVSSHGQKDNAAYLKNKMIGKENSQLVTKAIKNRRFSSNIRDCSPFELYRRLKICASKSPTFS